METKHRPHSGGLRRRWIVSAVLPVVAVVVAVLAVYTISVRQSCYDSLCAGLETRARIASDSFVSYGMKSYSEYFRYASVTVETFEEKDRLELQFINANGRVQVSSYGLTAGTSPGTSDITDAISGKDIASFVGYDPQTGEKILAVSAPLFFNSRVIGVLRYVTSLREADRSITLSFAAAAGVALLCVVMTLLSNAIFINKVVEPVAVVSDAARRISGGSYGFLVDNRYRDELGELVDNINDMSLKISQAEKLQQEFVSSVSHELRTPLTAINGWAETLAADPTSDPVQTQRGLGIIVKESRRLTSMVEELLDFTRIQDGRFTLRVEEIDLIAELEDAIFTYREIFRHEGIELRYSCEDDIPTIVADGERMKQVFCNVLDNAAKHGGSGKRIDVSVLTTGAYLIIRVRDFGPGIPSDELPFVKQKFYKGSSRARGSGIGLAVCDEIMRRHGGSLSIANAPEGGTVVSMALPLQK